MVSVSQFWLKIYIFLSFSSSSSSSSFFPSYEMNEKKRKIPNNKTKKEKEEKKKSIYMNINIYIYTLGTWQNMQFMIYNGKKPRVWKGYHIWLPRRNAKNRFLSINVIILFFTLFIIDLLCSIICFFLFVYNGRAKKKYFLQILNRILSP